VSGTKRLASVVLHPATSSTDPTISSVFIDLFPQR
jgi:hypothetical protein